MDESATLNSSQSNGHIVLWSNFVYFPVSSQAKSQIICQDLKSCRQVASSVKNILVPYDDSPLSQRAFAYALDLASHYGATITTLTVMYESPTGPLGITHETSIDEDRVKKLQNSFKIMKEAASEFGISVKNDTTVRTDVLQAILSYVVDHKIDQIVVGSRSRVGPDRYTTGSIALGICKSAKCPVVLVK